TARFRAAAPGDYVVDLACGGGCRDAGLRAFGAGNAAALAVGRPTQPARAAGGGQDGHAGATLEMIGVEPGEYRLRFTLSCGRRTCPYGYRVYHRAPLPDSASVVLAAADRASVAVAQARRTGDPRPLLTAWTGAALADQAGQVAELRRAGRYEESRLLEQEICALAVSPDRRTATARVMERWEVTRHHPDSVPRHTVDPPAVQDMTLRWEPGGWKIAAITFRSGQRC
ncbi:MAG TPA: hypothetical protein VFQ45_11685, partial [Longimicrobium sp.]|nr:hypothetical protein [Longimicrobium sp.]